MRKVRVNGVKKRETNAKSARWFTRYQRGVQIPIREERKKRRRLVEILLSAGRKKRKHENEKYEGGGKVNREERRRKRVKGPLRLGKKQRKSKEKTISRLRKNNGGANPSSRNLTGKKVKMI